MTLDFKDTIAVYRPGKRVYEFIQKYNDAGWYKLISGPDIEGIHIANLHRLEGRQGVLKITPHFTAFPEEEMEYVILSETLKATDGRWIPAVRIRSITKRYSNTWYRSHKKALIPIIYTTPTIRVLNEPSAPPVVARPPVVAPAPPVAPRPPAVVPAPVPQVVARTTISSRPTITDPQRQFLITVRDALNTLDNVQSTIALARARTILQRQSTTSVSFDPLQTQPHTRTVVQRPALQVATPSQRQRQTQPSMPLYVANLIIREAETKKEKCPISLDDITSENASVTSCFHVFTKDAIQRHRASGNTKCPVCRQECSITHIT